MGKVAANDERGRGRPLSESERQVAGAPAKVEDPEAGLQCGLGGGASPPPNVEIQAQDVVQEVVPSRDRAEHGFDAGRLFALDGGRHGESIAIPKSAPRLSEVLPLTPL
jgi:hypothetical protein